MSLTLCIQMIWVLSSSLSSLPALCLVPVWHRRLKSKVDYSGAFGAAGSDEGELLNEAGPRHAQQRPCRPNAIRATLVLCSCVRTYVFMQGTKLQGWYKNGVVCPNSSGLHKYAMTYSSLHPAHPDDFSTLSSSSSKKKRGGQEQSAKEDARALKDVSNQAPSSKRPR